MEIPTLINKMEACIVEVENNNLRNEHKEEGIFLDRDMKIQKNWTSLINPPLLCSKSNNAMRA